MLDGEQRLRERVHSSRDCEGFAVLSTEDDLPTLDLGRRHMPAVSELDRT